MASAAARADVMLSSRQSGVRSSRASCGVLAQVVLGEWLLDQQQVELVEAGEVAGVAQGVGAVGVDLEQRRRARRGARTAATRSMSWPGLDLELDPPVAVGEVAVDGGQRLGEGVEQPHRHAGRDAVAGAAEVAPAATVPAARSSASSTAASTAHLAIVQPLTGASSSATSRPPSRRPPTSSRGTQVVAQDEQRRVGELGRVERLDAGDVLAPAVAVVGRRRAPGSRRDRPARRTTCGTA